MLQGALLLVFGAFILSQALLGGPASRNYYVDVGLGISVVVVGVVAIIVLYRIASWKAPSGLTVDALALTLTFGDGHTARMGWTDPATKLQVTDYRASGVPASSDKEGALSYASHSVQVPGAAIDAVMGQAWSRAGAIFVRRWPRSGPQFGDIVGWDIRGDRAARPKSSAWVVPLERRSN